MQVLNKNIIFSDDVIVKEFSELLEKEDINLIKTHTIPRETLDDSLTILLVNNNFLNNNLVRFKSLKKSSDEIFFSIIFISKDETELI